MEGQSQNATEQAASSLPQEGYISRSTLTLRWFERKSILALDNRGVPSSSSSSFPNFQTSLAPLIVICIGLRSAPKILEKNRFAPLP